MKIVLDTNCLLMSISKFSDFFWLWQAFRDKKIVLYYSTDMLCEYHEIMSRFYSSTVADNIVEEILHASNTEQVTTYDKWNLVTDDPDDNKFVDCALNGGVDFIISNDHHFNVLKNYNFPLIKVANIDEFKGILHQCN